MSAVHPVRVPIRIRRAEKGAVRVPQITDLGHTHRRRAEARRELVKLEKFFDQQGEPDEAERIGVHGHIHFVRGKNAFGRDKGHGKNINCKNNFFHRFFINVY